MLKTPANPAGLPIEIFDQLRAGVIADRSQFFKDLSMPFYGYNRPGAKISEGVRESFWLQGMMCGFPGAYFASKRSQKPTSLRTLKKSMSNANIAWRRRPNCTYSRRRDCCHPK